MKTLSFYFYILTLMLILESCMDSPSVKEFETQSSNFHSEQVVKGTLMYDFSDNETFDSFIEKFSLDSLFQVSRIEFPVRKIYLNEALNEQEKVVNERDWWRVVFEETNDYKMRYYEKGKGGIGFVEFNGIDNGISITYTFELKDGQWYLVEVKDLST